MKVIKKFFGILLCFCAFGFTVATEQVEPSMQLFFIALVFACVFGAVILLKKTKNAKTPVVTQSRAEVGPVAITAEYEPSAVPDDAAKEMRRNYSLMQAKRDAEIMSESFKLASSTVAMDVFCMRYDLAMRKAHILLQAEQAGVQDIKKLKCHNACVAVINAALSLKKRMLTDYEQNSFSQAEALKTDKGKLNRYTKIKQTLIDAEPTFITMDEYRRLLDKVNDRILSLDGSLPSHTAPDLDSAQAKAEEGSSPLLFDKNGGFLSRTDGQPLDDADVSFLVERGKERVLRKYKEIENRGTTSTIITDVELSNNEKLFFDAFSQALLNEGLNPGHVSLQRLGSGILNVDYHPACYVGKIRILPDTQEKCYMQCIGIRGAIREYQDKPINDIIDNIPIWVKYIKHSTQKHKRVLS